jgi:mannose-6-phosphate isomerase
MKDTNSIIELQGTVQPYAWGGQQFIAQLLQQPSTGKPMAEYWLGAHSSASTQLVNTTVANTLNDLLAQEGKNWLGTRHSFDALPFLLKVLDVHDMLSIQVHPTKTEAVKGFARENMLGIPLNAPNRNYKDDNHKPEVMVALSDFYLLHGFLELTKMQLVLDSYEPFNPLKKLVTQESYTRLYAHVMQLPQNEVDAILSPIVKICHQQIQQGNDSKLFPYYWVNKLYPTPVEANIDRGLFSIFFFNIVYIPKGYGIFQAAGVPHAYLEGQNVELMANSDNVLRGGLTPKHIDVSELLKHTICTPTIPKLLAPTADVTDYQFPVPDFALGHWQLGAQTPSMQHTSSNFGILLCTGGEAVLKNSHGQFVVKEGKAFAIQAGTSFEITTASTAALFFAYIPNFNG